MGHDPVLVEIGRGPVVENVHHGAFVVCDGAGRILEQAGDIERPVFPRSCVKPLQAIPLVASGAASRYGFGKAELALACASHVGDPVHAQTAFSMLDKLGLDESCLRCRPAWPARGSSARALARQGGEASPLHHACSGKHAGFLCLSCHESGSGGGYAEFTHSTQQRIARTLARVTGAAHDEHNRGIDGCFVPTYAIPLTALALGFARFGTGEQMSHEEAQACFVLRDALMHHPDQIAGQGRLDSLLLEHGQIIAKFGADGVYAACLPKQGLGIAVKCRDGSLKAARIIMACLLLRWAKPEGDVRDLLIEHAAGISQKDVAQPVTWAKPCSFLNEETTIC